MQEINPVKPIMVTGASGYLASWIVKYLLDEGYTVRGSVRNKNNAYKTAHLEETIARGAPGKLELFEADLLQEGAFESAMEDCQLVIHTASPFQNSSKNPQKELIEPALLGTRNVLNTAKAVESVRRVVLTSSVVAVYGDSREIEDTPDDVFNEADWNLTSDENYQPYAYSKTVAEKEAWRIAQAQHQWDLVVINPAFILGPSLSRRTEGVSTDFVLSMVNGKFKAGVPDLYYGIADVRDVAEAHIKAGFIPSASGRHIISCAELSLLEIAQLIRSHFGKKYPTPKRKLPKGLLYLLAPFLGFSWRYIRDNVGYPIRIDPTYSVQDLYLEYRPVLETLVDQVKQLEDMGLV